MSAKNSLKNSLIDADDSVLVVIDVQESFLKKFSADERELLLNRIGWIVSVATRLDIPLVAMAEESVAPDCRKVSEGYSYP